MQDNSRYPDDWECAFCYTQNRWDRLECYCCERPQHYHMDQCQALAVARELNRLEKRCRWLEHRAIALNFAGRKMYWKQGCGHERRFIVSDGAVGDWCALCEVKGLEEIARMWAHNLIRRD